MALTRAKILHELSGLAFCVVVVAAYIGLAAVIGFVFGVFPHDH